MTMIFRVQGKDGRGPFKPGMTRRWVQDDGPDPLPTVTREFGHGIIQTLQAILDREGGACGCGCLDVEGIERWFTPMERTKLHELGYRLVTMAVDRVLAQSAHQVVFWRRRPLQSDFTVLRWPASANPPTPPPGRAT